MKLEQYLRSQYYNYIRSLFIKNECDICNDIDNLELHHIPQFSELLKEALDILDLNYKQDVENYTKEELIKINLVLLGLQVKCKYLTLCEPCHNNIHENDLLFTFSNRTKADAEAYKTFKYDVSNKYINKRLDNNDKTIIVSDIAEKYNYPLRLLSWQKVKEILINNNYVLTVDNRGTFINKEKYSKEYINKIENHIKSISDYMLNLLNKPLDKNKKIELINLINARENGRIQKSYSKINEWLHSNNIPFMINSKRSTNDNRKETYWIINNIK